MLVIIAQKFLTEMSVSQLHKWAKLRQSFVWFLGNATGG